MWWPRTVSLLSPTPSLTDLLDQYLAADERVEERRGAVLARNDIEALAGLHYGGQIVQYKGRIFKIRKPYKLRGIDRPGSIDVSKIDQVL